MHLPLEDTAQIRRVAAAVEGQFGRADILVNSAGFTRMAPHADLEALDDELIDAVLTANVRGPFATIRAFAPLLRSSGNGLIVNISSGAAARGGGSSIIYGASKAALDTMSMALARVLAPEIRVIKAPSAKASRVDPPPPRAPARPPTKGTRKRGADRQHRATPAGLARSEPAGTIRARMTLCARQACIITRRVSWL